MEKDLIPYSKVVALTAPLKFKSSSNGEVELLKSSLSLTKCNLNISSKAYFPAVSRDALDISYPPSKWKRPYHTSELLREEWH